MPQFKLRDGSVVEAPADLTPEEGAWLKEQGGVPLTAGAAPVAKPSVGMDVLKSGASGLAEGAIRAPFVAGDLASLGARGVNMVRPGTFSPNAETPMSDKVIQALSDTPGNLAAANGRPFSSAEPLSFYDPQTTEGRYANSIGNGVGGLVLGGAGAFKGPIQLGRAPGMGPTIKALSARMALNPAVQAGTVGAAGEFAGDMSRNFNENEHQNPVARLIGSAGTAAAQALASFLMKRSAARPLHEVFKDSSRADFDQANAETARLQRAGVTQNTVGDSFINSNPQVAAMEREVSNELGGTALGRKLTGRVSGDIPRLEATSNAEINSAVVPNATAPSGRYPTAQEDLLQQARAARTNAVRAHEEASPLVPVGDAAAIVRALRQRAQTPGNRRTLDADFANMTARTVAGGYRYDMPQGAAPAGPGRASGFTPVTPLNQAPPVAPAGVGGTPLPGGMLALPAPPTRAVAPAGTPPTGTLGPPVLDPSAFGMGPKPMSDFQMPQTPDITTIDPAAVRTPQGLNLVELSKRINALNTAAPKGAAAADNASVLDKNVAVARGQALAVARRELAARNPHYAAGQQAYQDMSPGVDALKVLTEHPTVLQASTSLRPNPVREALIAHLQGVDGALAQSTSERLRAADILSRNTAQHGIQGLQQELGQTGAASAASPWYSLYKGISTAGKRSANEDISRLLANPTQANMRVLQDLARNNPDLARSLVRQGLIGAVSATTQTEGSAP